VGTAKCLREGKAGCILAIKAVVGAIFDCIAVYSGMGMVNEIGTGRFEILSKDIRSLRWVSTRSSDTET
jgi:hypothetical protein